MHVRQEHRTGFDSNVGLQVHAVGVLHRYTGPHQRLVDARAHECLDPGELREAIDPSDLGRNGLERVERMPFASEDLDDVGQVVLTLDIVEPHLWKGFGEQPRIEHVHAAIDLPNPTLRFARVDVLHDPHDAIPPVADDPPIPGRVADLGGQHRHGRTGTPMQTDQFAQGGRHEQGHVAWRYQDGVALVRRYRVERDTRRVPGAQSLFLHHHVDVVIEKRSHLVPVDADDDHDLVQFHRSHRRQHPRDHRSAGDGVQYLREIGLHAGTCPRGEYYCSHSHSALLGRWGKGLEPLLTGPKPVVLPLHHPPQRGLGRRRVYNCGSTRTPP